jgi:hypothetical protein
MHNVSHPRRRILSRLAFGLLALALALGMPLTGYAKVLSCRGDPIIDLPYVRIETVADIATSVANVDKVVYVYHLPLASAPPVLFDSSELASKEVVQFVYDMAPGSARVDTTVYLKPGVARVRVTATTTVTERLFGVSVVKTARGFSGQTLTVLASKH